MAITEPFNQLSAAAVSVVRFIGGRKRLSISMAAVLLITGPLLTGTGGETFVLNLTGLGIVAQAVRPGRQCQGKTAGATGQWPAPAPPIAAQVPTYGKPVAERR